MPSSLSELVAFGSRTHREGVDGQVTLSSIGHYRQHESLFTKTDAKDRHVAAAAVVAR